MHILLCDTEHFLPSSWYLGETVYTTVYIIIDIDVY